MYNIAKQCFNLHEGTEKKVKTTITDALLSM